MSRQMRGLALAIPGLRRVLLEKRQLQTQVQRLESQVSHLAQQNETLKKRVAQQPPPKETIWPLLKAEILQAEKKKPGPAARPLKRLPPFTLNWVVQALSPASGGQADIYRTIKYLAQKGHHCRIYIFDVTEKSSLAKQKLAIKTHFPDLNAELFYNSRTMADCDAIFATHWLTAYRVYNFNGKGRKYYYAQGYEPHTQPMGYLSHLAEQTYSFGFRGITLGEWLQEKLTKDYKMKCDYFDFGYDPAEYFHTDEPRSKDVFYYAQPQKAHRGFELGIMALEIFHAKHPDAKIHLFGADISAHKIPFPYVDRGIMSVHELNSLYNHCAAGLALSFTNISLIPLEMIAAGCVPVVNDAYHTHKIKYADRVIYAEPSPLATAEALSRAISLPPPKADDLADRYTWDHSNQKIEEILVKDFS